MYLPICPFCGFEDIRKTENGFYCSDCEDEFYESDLVPEDDYFIHNPQKNKIDTLEEKIWDAITENSKTKFNYQNFSDDFDDFVEENVKDNILWNIIMRASAGQQALEISAYIYHDLALLGLSYPQDELENFVNDRIKDFGLEIYVTQLATTLLNDGTPAIDVLKSVHQLFSKRNK